MKEEKDYVGLEAAELLNEDGFNEWCDAMWSCCSFIPQSTIDKYGELSDDGFYELTKDGGGDLEWEDVYSNEPHLEFQNNSNNYNHIYGGTCVSAPLIQIAQKYIREKYNLEIEVFVDSPKKYCFNVCNLNDGTSWMSNGKGVIRVGLPSYEDCINTAITLILNELKNETDG